MKKHHLRSNLNKNMFVHYSRQPLNDAYPESYQKIKKRYGKKLDHWLEEWERDIEEKYQQTEEESPEIEQKVAYG